MGKYVLMAMVFFQCLTFGAEPAGEGFGIGVIVGEPTGISFKNWLTAATAVDGGAAWSFEGKDAFHLHADYLFHNDKLAKVDQGKMLFYYGIGGRLKLQDDSRLGVRIPFGVAYLLESAPFDFFLEIVPIMDLIPETELEFNGGFGVRIFF